MALVDALERAVAAAVAGARKPAVFFSGGIDSSLLAFLAKKSRPDLVLYVAGVEGSQDLARAQENAHAMGFPEEKITCIILRDEDLISLLEESKTITRETSLTKLELSLILLALCTRAKNDCVDVALSGSGAEELFLGYTAHRLSLESGEDLETLRENELAGLYEKDLRRGARVAEHCGVQLALPFQDAGVIEEARAIPASENFRGGENKSVLRTAARSLGLPEAICGRPKRAMQYGSGVHASIIRLKHNKRIAV